MAAHEPAMLCWYKTHSSGKILWMGLIQDYCIFMKESQMDPDVFILCSCTHKILSPLSSSCLLQSSATFLTLFFISFYLCIQKDVCYRLLNWGEKKERKFQHTSPQVAKLLTNLVIIKLLPENFPPRWKSKAHLLSPSQKQCSLQSVLFVLTNLGYSRPRKS